MLIRATASSPSLMKTKNETEITVANTVIQPSWLKIVQDRVSGLRFGTVQIVVHEGRVTQVDSTERTRLPADESAAA